MEQRSQEWFRARIGRITGSVVGAILELDPNCTRGEAMRRMVRSYHNAPSEFVGNIATQWGVTHEDEAREDFERAIKMDVKPATFILSKDTPWLGASPDGLIGENAIFEAKCPFGLREIEKPVPFKSIEDQPHYYAQIQVQLYCARRSLCYFWQWTPYDTSLTLVAYSEAWINENLPKLKAFYDEFLIECESPEPYLEEKRKIVDTPRALQMVAEYTDLQDAIAKAEERKKELLESIVEMCGKTNAVFGGKKLTKVEKSGSISYASAIKHLAPDANLEPWRGKPSSYWMLK